MGENPYILKGGISLWIDLLSKLVKKGGERKNEIEKTLE